MILKDLRYSYDDVMIVPSYLSSISSRKECNPFYENGRLPIFTAPMDSVADDINYQIFEDNKINVVIPRTVDLDIRKSLWHERFVALSLSESKAIFEEETFNEKRHICIDVANGHMSCLLTLIGRLKNKFGDNIIIMAGNIASPSTYVEYSKVGCDYVRVGIGGGEQCLSSNHTGIHYPYASLIDQVSRAKKECNGRTKIIADGNIKNYGDINKALALGADYVMIGTLLATAWESAAETFITEVVRDCKDCMVEGANPLKECPIFDCHSTAKEFIKEKTPLERSIFSGSGHFNKDYTYSKRIYGMSTKTAQKAMGKDILTTSEGVERYKECTFTLGSWAENCIDYIKSCMSYTNSQTLNDFIGDCELVLITNSTKNRLEK